MASSTTGSTGKLETIEAVVEIKSSADKVYGIIRSEQHNVPKASSDNVHEVEVHEGDWETSGSIKLWKYTIDGTVETFKEKVEIDEANKIVSLTALDGHVLEQYRSYKVNFQVIPKTGEGANMVNITLEFEKLNESDQPPNKYLSFLVNVIKDIDAHVIDFRYTTPDDLSCMIDQYIYENKGS